MIKVSDLVMQFLQTRGVDVVFTVTGGGIMHLVDSLGRASGLRYICNHHEQACAIAAESYARRRNHVGALLVTTGPGSTNALSAVAGAFVDSIPLMVISGQVRRDLFADFTQERQFGPQEINIEAMATPVTKHFVTVLDPERIQFELEQAWHHAVSGRPGPVWVNLPLDIQGALVDERLLEGFTPPALETRTVDLDPCLNLMKEARRPLWVFGNGIHLSQAQQLMRNVLEASGIPAVSTIGGLDLLPESHPLNMGHFGPVGQRRANFALQNADLILAVGASLSVASIGFNQDGFAPRARKVMVNVDPVELAKRHLRLDAALAMDPATFFQAILPMLPAATPRQSPRWIPICHEWKARYPVLAPEHVHREGYLNSYAFAHALSRCLPPGATVVTGNALDIVSIFHSFEIQEDQRVYTNINFGAMGWDLPATVGAAVAGTTAPVILVTGDGSFQLNLQELLTIRQYGLPVKLFVLNNQGYESIRSTQRAYFSGLLVGSDPASGVGNPDYRHLAAAYGMDYRLLLSAEHLEADLRSLLSAPGALLAEVKVHPDQGRSPKVTSTRTEDGRMVAHPLENQFPFLPPEEVAANMSLFVDEA